MDHVAWMGMPNVIMVQKPRTPWLASLLEIRTPSFRKAYVRCGFTVASVVESLCAPDDDLILLGDAEDPVLIGSSKTITKIRFDAWMARAEGRETPVLPS